MEASECWFVLKARAFFALKKCGQKNFNFLLKMLDLKGVIVYNYYAVKYGLMPKVTLVTGNQRELGRTSSWQDRERLTLIHIFYCSAA